MTHYETQQQIEHALCEGRNHLPDDSLINTLIETRPRHGAPDGVLLPCKCGAYLWSATQRRDAR